MTEDIEPAVMTANFRRPEGEVGVTIADMMARSNLMMAQLCFGALAAKPGETIVEVGPASGKLSVPVLQALGKDGRYIGIDHSEDMAERARDYLADQTECPIEFIVGDCVDADIPDGSVDGVFANNVLYFIEDLGPFFQSAARWLRPGGRAVFGIATENTLRAHPLIGDEFNVRSVDTYLRTFAKGGFEDLNARYFGPYIRNIRGTELEADFTVISGRRRP